MLLFEILPYRDGLADAFAVVEFERRHLSAGVTIGVGRLAILCRHQIDLLRGNRNSLLGQKHSRRARIGSESIVELHGWFPRQKKLLAEYTTGISQAGTECEGVLRWYVAVCRNLQMRFCPQCGAPLMAGAKFCVDCGRALEGTAASAGAPGPAGAGRGRGTAISTAFV